MKIIRIIRNCAKLPLLLILATLTVSAHASTGETLKSLHEMRTLNYSILGNYYMFSGLEGDSRYGRQMDSGIKKFDTHMDAVLRQDMSNVSELANVVSNWKEYKNLINTNRSEFLKQGYASARLVDDLVKKTQILNSSLNNLYSTLKSSKPLSDAASSPWSQLQTPIASSTLKQTVYRVLWWINIVIIW